MIFFMMTYIFDSKCKVKLSPLQAVKANWGCGCKGPHILLHGTRNKMLASSTLGRLYPGKARLLLFYWMLSGFPDQSRYEGVKKNLHPSDTRDRTRAVQPIAKRLAA